MHTINSIVTIDWSRNDVSTSWTPLGYCYRFAFYSSTIIAKHNSQPLPTKKIPLFEIHLRYLTWLSMLAMAFKYSNMDLILFGAGFPSIPFLLLPIFPMWSLWFLFRFNFRCFRISLYFICFDNLFFFSSSLIESVLKTVCMFAVFSLEGEVKSEQMKKTISANIKTMPPTTLNTTLMYKIIKTTNKYTNVICIRSTRQSESEKEREKLLTQNKPIMLNGNEEEYQ